MTQGIENEDQRQSEATADHKAMTVSLPSWHQRLIQVEILDVTDFNNQLVQTREWLLHTKDAGNLKLTGNLFAVECPLSGEGKVFIKCGPLPRTRAIDGAVVDLTVRPRRKEGGYAYALHQTGPEDIEPWVVLDFQGGSVGMTRALHRWQRLLRPQTKQHQVPKFLSNSWGDRNRDSRIQEAFMLEEIERAARLGVDVVQIDDGWQKGRSCNSAEAAEKNGVWSGFWNADPEFWTPDPERFPNGLDPLVQRAAALGIEIGLWYAPDSCDEFRNWERDANQILSLHQRYGVEHFKLDSINVETITARRNLATMFKAILAGSAGNIVCDLDVTAGKRPGYFGELTTGPLFVENRYSDWHSYWPHFTLRNLWQLSRWVDPGRLRMELLNHARNDHKYEGDPLAPSLYPPATLFATVMFSNPLGWFENTGLPDAFIADVAPLVTCWKQHREQIFAGDIIPIGAAPDGVTWTGFFSDGGEAKASYAVLFNEKSRSRTHRFALPRSFSNVELLSGQGEVGVDADGVAATIEDPFGYLFVRLSE